ncbi:MAG: hypothetical protein JWM52_274 [Candidatus Saccharibacteria bacterium]|nr:hypothetical protein [Candidatus Saccharibacteria bacterium]
MNEPTENTTVADATMMYSKVAYAKPGASSPSDGPFEWLLEWKDNKLVLTDQHRDPATLEYANEVVLEADISQIQKISGSTSILSIYIDGKKYTFNFYVGFRGLFTNERELDQKLKEGPYRWVELFRNKGLKVSYISQRKQWAYIIGLLLGGILLIIIVLPIVVSLTHK